MSDSRPLPRPLVARVLLALVATSLCFFLGGCGPRTIKHEYALSPGSPSPSAGTRVLLIPVNETEAVPGGLDIADHVLNELITQHLESKGLVVERIDEIPYRRAVQIAIARAESDMLSGQSGSVSGTIAYADVIPPLLAELESDAELVVVPNIAQRGGEYTGGSMIRWDGVRRRENIRGGRTITGTGIPVASLHSLVFDKSGRQLFSGYGGLDAIFETNIQKKRYDLKADLFQNEEFLAEGICISFHPFFGLDERC